MSVVGDGRGVGSGRGVDGDGDPQLLPPEKLDGGGGGGGAGGSIGLETDGVGLGAATGFGAAFLAAGFDFFLVAFFLATFFFAFFLTAFFFVVFFFAFLRVAFFFFFATFFLAFLRVAFFFFFATFFFAFFLAFFFVVFFLAFLRVVFFFFLATFFLAFFFVVFFLAFRFFAAMRCIPPVSSLPRSLTFASCLTNVTNIKRQTQGPELESIDRLWSFQGVRHYLSNRWMGIATVTLTVVACTEAPPRETQVSEGDKAAKPLTLHDKVLVVGVDGMTFEVLRPLIRAGKAPTLASMVAQGASGVLKSETPMRSPALWTTVATGQPREVHQIYDFVTGSAFWPKAMRSHEQKLVTSSMRYSPALWNLASAAGQEVLVVGWLNTWPAEKVRGAMVAPYVALGQSKQTSIKGKIYRDAQGQTYPKSLFKRLKPNVLAAGDVTSQMLHTVIPKEAEHADVLDAIPMLKRYLYTIRWSIAGAETNTRLLEELYRRHPKARLAMTYFDGTDTLAHRFWVFRQSKKDIRARLKAHGLPEKHAAALKRLFGAVLDNYYSMVDGWLARLQKAAGPDTTILVLSDHGWGNAPEVKAPYDHVPFDGAHRLEGVLIASGPHVKHTQHAGHTLYDIAPTVTYLLNLGVPATMPGKVMTDLLREQLLASRPQTRLATRKISSHAAQAATKDTAHFAETELERLRSLGYVQ